MIEQSCNYRYTVTYNGKQALILNYSPIYYIKIAVHGVQLYQKCVYVQLYKKCMYSCTQVPMALHYSIKLPLSI